VILIELDLIPAREQIPSTNPSSDLDEGNCLFQGGAGKFRKDTQDKVNVVFIRNQIAV